MSLLIKALEQAARNRNKTATDADIRASAASSDEPALEATPVQPPPNATPPTLEPLSSRPTTHTGAPQSSDTVEQSNTQSSRAAASTTARRATSSPASMVNLDAQHQHTRSAGGGGMMPGVRLYVQRYPLAAIGVLAVLLGVALGAYVYVQTAQPGLIVTKPASNAAPHIGPTAVAPEARQPDFAVPIPGASTVAAPSAPPAVIPSSLAEGLRPAAPMSSSVLIHTPNSAQQQRESGAARVSSRASATEELHVPGRPPLEAPPASARSTLPVSAEPVRAREMIKVLPTAREVRLNPELVQAHSALQAGDFGSSRNLYARVMLSDPLNTDALLGMAYIATHDNRIEDAAKLYLRILQAHPRHAAAQAALISMMSKADPLSAETQLRQLISREPSAFLHFVLGNVYADQSLWSQAQLAYFQAHHLEPDNADYAYNLAIGLDHLHQSKVALNFYRRAEQLATTHGRAHFNLSRLRERISALAMYVE